MMKRLVLCVVAIGIACGLVFADSWDGGGVGRNKFYLNGVGKGAYSILGNYSATVTKFHFVTYSGHTWVCVKNNGSASPQRPSSNSGYWGRWTGTAGPAGPAGPAGSGAGDMLKSENLSGLSSYATARTNLGLVIGTNVQAYNSNLTGINQALTSSSNPSFGTLNLVSANALNLGTSGTNAGEVRFKSGTAANNYYFSILGSNFGANIGWTLPTSAPSGNDYLVKASTTGVLGYTDPASFAASGHNHSGTYEPVQTAASQAEAEAGTSTSIRSWTPQRVGQAIAALGGAGHAAVTLGTANGLSLSTQQLSLAAATNASPGAATAAQITELERLSQVAPAGSDGNYGITLNNNTAKLPTASKDELYFEGNILKINQNGTEYSSVLSPTATQVNFSGTLTNTYLCTFATGGAISCNTNPASFQTALTNPLVAGTMVTGNYCTKNAATNTIDCNSAGTGTMTYPGAGIPQSTGSAWGTSITAGTGVVTAMANAVNGSGGFLTSAATVGNLTASTSAAVGIGTIELGAASDTTIARSAAGVITVEGVTVTRTIASGTSALGTSAIASGACATVVTTTATGTATTDVINWGFNGDPTGVTGYAPSANGMLTIIAYPSANNVNFKCCNNTALSVTPGAITLNWSVNR